MRLNSIARWMVNDRALEVEWVGNNLAVQQPNPEDLQKHELK